MRTSRASPTPASIGAGNRRKRVRSSSGAPEACIAVRSTPDCSSRLRDLPNKLSSSGKRSPRSHYSTDRIHSNRWANFVDACLRLPHATGNTSSVCAAPTQRGSPRGNAVPPARPRTPPIRTRRCSRASARVVPAPLSGLRTCALPVLCAAPWCRSPMRIDPGQASAARHAAPLPTPWARTVVRPAG